MQVLDEFAQALRGQFAQFVQFVAGSRSGLTCMERAHTVVFYCVRPAWLKAAARAT